MAPRGIEVGPYLSPELFSRRWFLPELGNASTIGPEARVPRAEARVPRARRVCTELGGSAGAAADGRTGPRWRPSPVRLSSGAGLGQVAQCTPAACMGRDWPGVREVGVGQGRCVSEGLLLQPLRPRGVGILCKAGPTGAWLFLQAQAWPPRALSPRLLQNRCKLC